MIFIFRFAFTCVFARITTSYTTLEKTNRLALLIERDTDNLFALAPENIFPQDSDLLSQDSDPLFQDSDSFFEDSSDSLIQNSDPLLPPNGVDNALQSVDQTSATTCDEIQSNLNLFSDSPPSLNARDLADELPGFKDFLAPLNQIKDSTCVAPKNPQQPGGSNPGGQNRQNSDLPAPLPDQKRYQYQVAVYGTCYFMGVVSPLHPLALCCDGLREGANVHDCDNYQIGPKCQVLANQYCCQSYTSQEHLGIGCVPVIYEPVDRPPTPPPPPSRRYRPTEEAPVFDPPVGYEEPWFGKPGWGGG